jgi:hypothetical protein
MSILLRKHAPASLPPHEAILWACALDAEETEIRTALEALLTQGEIDWHACTRMSMRQGVAYLAAYHLHPFTLAGTIPTEVAACFARMLHANRRRNIVLFRECARLLRGLHAAGIPCLVLKGVGLALTVYEDQALRNFADIDLLVPARELDHAGRIVQELDFAPGHDEPDRCVLHRTYVGSCEEDILTETLPLEYEAATMRTRAEPFRHCVVVEIHQGLFRDAAGMMRHLAETPLWRSPRQACLPDGTPMWLPSPEVTLVHLAAHAADHGFARLIYFHDIAVTIRHGGAGIDWALTLDLAVRYGVEGYLYRCLEFVCRECGVQVPEQVLTALVGRGKRRVRPLQRADIFGAEREFSTGIVLQRLWLEPDWRRFCAALRNILFPPPVIMRRLYGVNHALPVALLYVARPLLLTGHLARMLLHRARM